MAATHPASCACSHVRFRLTSAPMFIHCCHCTDCQRQTGSAFVLNALIEADRVVVEAGAVEQAALPTDSGKPHVVSRCPRCRTALWSTYGGREQVRFVRVGTLDDARAFTPDVHIFTQSKLPWVGLPDDVPAFPIFYAQMSDVWSADALARREAASQGAR